MKKVGYLLNYKLMKIEKNIELNKISSVIII